MSWSSTHPLKSGWYWYRAADHPAEFIFVDLDTGGDLGAMIKPGFEQRCGRARAQWVGPVVAETWTPTPPRQPGRYLFRSPRYGTEETLVHIAICKPDGSIMTYPLMTGQAPLRLVGEWAGPLEPPA